MSDYDRLPSIRGSVAELFRRTDAAVMEFQPRSHVPTEDGTLQMVDGVVILGGDGQDAAPVNATAGEPLAPIELNVFTDFDGPTVYADVAWFPGEYDDGTADLSFQGWQVEWEVLNGGVPVGYKRIEDVMPGVGGVERETRIEGLLPATDYVVTVRAVNAVGVAGTEAATLAFTTPAVPLGGSDGVAPASSPQPFVTGVPGQIMLTWDLVEQSDPVTYDIHMSTVAAFTPDDATTKIGETQGGIYFVKKTKAGADLTYGTPYYFRLVARDSDGAAAPGLESSGSPIQIGSNDLGSNAVISDKIAAGAVSFPALMVGSYDNLAPKTSDAAAWSRTGGMAVVTVETLAPRTGASHLRVTSAAGLATSTFLMAYSLTNDVNRHVKVIAGEKYYWDIWVRSAVATARQARVRATFRNASGTSVGHYAGPATTMTTAYQRLAIMTGNAPATATHLTFDIEFLVHATEALDAYVDDGYMRRVVDGVIIADGAITAPKVVAGLIQAGSAIIADLAVGTAHIANAAITDLKVADLSATKIATGSLTSATITVGSSGEILVGTTSDGVRIRSTGIQQVQGDVVKVDLPVTGNATFTGAIVGSTMTGSLLRTAVSGQRIEIAGASPNEITFYSGEASESEPAEIDILQGAGWSNLHFRAPRLGTHYRAQVLVRSETSSTGNGQISMGMLNSSNAYVSGIGSFTCWPSATFKAGLTVEGNPMLYLRNAAGSAVGEASAIGSPLHLRIAATGSSTANVLVCADVETQSKTRDGTTGFVPHRASSHPTGSDLLLKKKILKPLYENDVELTDVWNSLVTGAASFLLAYEPDSTPRHRGFIANDLHAHLRSDFDGYAGYDLNAVVATLVAQIDKLSKKVLL